MLWTETSSQEQANERYGRMWGTVFTTTEDGWQGKVGGEGLYEGEQFWADAIKDARADPATRLAMGKKHLPLSAAFREAAIALRAIIRAKRKEGQAVEAELSELHRLAAIASLANYDALEITCFATIDALDLSPKAVGWDELPLLNKTDAKLMAETWPAPGKHTTGGRLYPRIASVASRLLAAQRERQMAQSLAAIDRMSQPREEKLEANRPKGFFSRLFGL
jgi:hypothetical protein